MEIIRERFTQQLKELEEDLLNMTHTAAKMLQMSIESLKERNIEKAEEAIALDDVVDDFNFKIEEKCLSLIALQQPVAKDLRVIAAILKVITDVERIGDYSVDIAKFSIRLAEKPLFKPLIDVPKMADLVRKMLEEAITALVQRDLTIVQKVVEADDQVDALYRSVHEEVVEHIEKDPSVTRQAIWILMIARYLERVGDHITNIAERVYYMETGELIELHQ
ncbi:MAG TPA: phosphate signaling complex protein PhoU [Candidatus Atribacteria bacterium]|uniref:phosphate signaling complex protein PhoU n=1 Tax=Candidatus Sordicultor fermentans TaxID=1953203 RepID=UPI001698E976|nr:phosphate signaling complex protein PhoU [Atribacterota bacterium]NLY05954.1 phosphate signaling complex protein PhoU [Candidatus Atribacteria bacterium]MDI9607746.1 phosphate signaling complex protein PhoU [Atribacterota bacterium]HOA98841.1 phosphate signaling complex protein PhoU [Candidatus Atribacteria bacterium]HOQ50678.1 phosphate signaling complex protein PhoU [Candidatus Atribacteria bacterium]